MTEDCKFISAHDGILCEDLAIIHVKNELAIEKCNERMKSIRSGF